MPKRPAASARSTSLAGFLLAAVSMAFAVGYLQMIEYLAPCPLCILDRGVVIALGCVFLVATVHNPLRVGRRIYAGLAALLSLTGIGICARHIWLQNLPADQVPECGAGFWYNLQTKAPGEFLNSIFNGSGECAEVHHIPGIAFLTLPQATLLLFVAFLAISIRLLLARDRQMIRRGYIG